MTTGAEAVAIDAENKTVTLASGEVLPYTTLVSTLPLPKLLEITTGLDGDKATGVWYMMGPWTFTETGEEKWFALKYNDDYVRTAEGWKYQHLRVELRMVAERTGTAP